MTSFFAHKFHASSKGKVAPCRANRAFPPWTPENREHAAAPRACSPRPPRDAPEARQRTLRQLASYGSRPRRRCRPRARLESEARFGRGAARASEQVGRQAQKLAENHARSASGRRGENFEFEHVFRLTDFWRSVRTERRGDEEMARQDATMQLTARSRCVTIRKSIWCLIAR
jgi:hypothetical protein